MLFKCVCVCVVVVCFKCVFCFKCGCLFKPASKTQKPEESKFACVSFKPASKTQKFEMCFRAGFKNTEA